MSQPLIASIGLLGGAVALLVDGSRAVIVAALAVGLALASAADTVGGAGGALVPLAAGAVTAAAGLGARGLAERLRRVPGLDPEIAVVAPRDVLFGPRSLRAVGGVMALLAASWVSLNVTVGDVASDRGAVFAVAFVWGVGGVRLVRARALEDLAVGGAVVGLAGSVAWILEVGAGSLAQAAALAGLAPLSAAVTGWLLGRHHRRPAGAP